VAFTTNAGNPTTIQGTDKVDVLSSVDLAGNFIVKADEAADVVTLVSTKDPSQLTDVSVYGQDGVDTITAPSAALFRGRTQGGEGADTITFSGNVNQYQTYGGADADTINIATVINSTVQGSKGNDIIGNNTALSLTGSVVYGGADDDTITVGTVLASTVQGSNGDDTINVQGTVTANSKINGGGENDTITIEDAASIVAKGSTVNGNKGADILRVETGVEIKDITIFGGSGNDNIDVVDSQTTISGDNGADTITSGTAKDTSVSGGDGNDIVTMESVLAASTQSVNGGEGNDAITLTNIGAAGTTVMQGRTDSSAATGFTGNGGAAEALADTDVIKMADGFDTVTNFELNTAFGLQLSTTAANTQTRATLNGGAVGGTLTWGNLTTAGQTSVLQGTYAAGQFTIDDSDGAGADDFLIIQGDGNALTANTSMLVLINDGNFDVNGGAATDTYLKGGMFTAYEA